MASNKPPVPRLGTPPSRPRTANGGTTSRPMTPGGYQDGHGGTTTAGGGERVKVVVRVRPPLRADEEGGAVAVSEEGTKLQLTRPAAQVHQTEHNYDVVLPTTATQQDVYVAAVKDVVEDVMNGYNGTVMAYGQTGAGKTHTLGNIEPNAIGMIPRAVAEIFKQADDDRAHVYTVGMSYIQIYMELIQDLLKPDTDNLQIREDGNGVFVAGVKEVKVNSMEQCLHYLELGEQNRTFAFTHLNAHSSRSHAVVMLTVTKRARHLSARESADMKALERDGVIPQKVKVGKLFLVDLAGSERLKKSKSVGIRATEAISINLSLTTLGMCINARATDSPHVPFRDSKLTRLLQESLGGNAKTSLIICVADVKAHVDESLMSLQFASRAMCVKNKPRINERIDYQALQAELMAELNSNDRNEKRREIAAELFRHDYEILQKERDQYRQIAEALTQENEEEECRRLRMLEKKEQELQAQQAALQRQQEQLEQHKKLQHQMSQTLQEVQRERDQYLKRTETLNVEREEERQRLLHIKEQEVVAQQQKAQHVQQKLHDAQRRVAALELQLHDVQDEKEALQHQNQELRGHLKSSVAVAEQLQQQLEEQQEDSQQKLLQEREQAASALAALHQERDAASTQHEEHVLRIIEKYTAEMQSAQEEHVGQVQDLKHRLRQAAEDRTTEVERLCTSHKEEMAGVRSRMEAIISSLHQDLAAAKEAHADDLAKVHEQHQEDNDNLHTTVRGLQADIRGQDELIQALQEQLDNSQRHSQLLESELQAARHHSTQLQEDLVASARAAGQLEDELQDARRQATQLQAAMLDVQAYSARLVSQMEQRFTDALAQKGRALETLQRQVAKLRAPLASLKQQRARLLSTRTHLTDQVGDLEGQVSDLQAVVATRTREAEVLANELLDSRREGEQLRRELEDLETEADSRAEENDTLREQLAALQEGMGKVKARLASSQHQCCSLEQQLEKFTADRANALQHRTALRKHHQAAAVIQRAWRTHAKKKLVSHLSQGERKLDMAIQKVSDLQQVQQQTHLTLGHNLVQSSMASFRDGVETIMATFMLPKRELQARLNAQQRMQNLSPGGGGFNAASPRVTPRRDSGSSAATNTPRTPPSSQRMPLSPLSSHLSRFTNPSPKGQRRLSNGSLY